MWKRELLKNKIYSLLFVGLGALSVLIEYDATFFVFSLMIGVPLFFAKENYIMDGGCDYHDDKESGRKSVPSISNRSRKEGYGYRDQKTDSRV